MLSSYQRVIIGLAVGYHQITKYFARIMKIYQEQTITYMGPNLTSQKLSRTFYFDNKQKHQLVLRRTSWCFVLLWPRHVFTKYFARIIKIYQEQTITYMGPVVTSQKLSRTFYLYNKQKHQLVLRGTSWCFEARAGALCFYGHIMFSPNILPEV